MDAGRDLKRCAFRIHLWACHRLLQLRSCPLPRAIGMPHDSPRGVNDGLIADNFLRHE
jgi:hypothetical protein